MSALVFVENGKAFTDSLTVAKEFGKSHDDVMRDIGIAIRVLVNLGEGKRWFPEFRRIYYMHPQSGERCIKYDMTEEAFTRVTFGYEATETKARFMETFKLMEARK